MKQDDWYDDDFDEQDDAYGYAEERYHSDWGDEFAGTYAHDEAGYSDDDIWTIFDGEPDAYWNID